MLVKLYTAAVQGIDATLITIEVNSSRGIKFFLVGLPDYIFRSIPVHFPVAYKA